MIDLIVYGMPAPQGSKKFVGRTATGRGIIANTSNKTEPWRNDVMAQCIRFMDNDINFEPFTCAVAVSMVFTFLRPKSVSVTKRPYCSTAPDLCKLARSTEDAISASGLWHDDALVVDYQRLAKVYAGEDEDALPRAGARIRIWAKPTRVITLGNKMDRPAIEAA